MNGVTATFYGSYTKIYLQYIDLSTYHTLVAVPGEVYTVGIASGWTGLAAVPADGSWGAVSEGMAQFSAVPALAVPGASVPGRPGEHAGGESGMDEEDAVADPDLEWAARVAASASEDPIYGEIRKQLDQAGEQIAVLRRKPREP